MRRRSLAVRASDADREQVLRRMIVNFGSCESESAPGFCMLPNRNASRAGCLQRSENGNRAAAQRILDELGAIARAPRQRAEQVARPNLPTIELHIADLGILASTEVERSTELGDQL